MQHFNKGLIITNDNCIGCNHCISVCPIPGANVSVIENGKNRIEVNEKMCIHCGHCIRACRHDAREYIDDTDEFFAALRAGEKLSIAVAPSFYMLYPDKAEKALSYLRSLGAGKIYNVSLGADITTWCYLNYIERNQNNSEVGTMLSQTCPALLNYMEKYDTDMLEKLIPVQSPLFCLAIYAHKYLGDTNRIAFIGPCIAKKDEIQSAETMGTVSFNVTFKHLMKRLENVKLDEYRPAVPDLDSFAMGGIIPADGGLKTAMYQFLPSDKVILSIDNATTYFPKLKNSDTLCQKDSGVYMLDVLGCDFGCIGGPAAESGAVDILGIASKKISDNKAAAFECDAGKLGSHKKRQILEERFGDLKLEDFLRGFSANSTKPGTVSEQTYDEIFKSMHKLTPESRKIDCGSCGYNSCRDMVYAIANGYNRRINCVHYAKDENLRLFLTDSVTGIRNSESFCRDCAELFKCRPDSMFAIGVFNIKGFKVINDLFGYDEGNRVLCYLAQHLAENIKSGEIFARLYSDNFAVCLPYSSERIDELIIAGHECCKNIKLDYPLSVDFGFCLADDPAAPVSQLIDHAQIAMQTVKGSYEVRSAFYDESMRSKIMHEAEITSEMHDALEQRQFVVFLQPQYNHATGEMVGAEALARWLHPVKGLVPPSAFIPVFEKNGFITNLDSYIWEEACRLLRKWLDSGEKVVPVSVNLSRMDMFIPHLARKLDLLTQKYNIPKRYLKLEITESAYVENPERLIVIVKRLRECGFIIEMDDFGSGYSSLNTLKDVPVDILKLDMKFISSCNTARGGNILQSVVRMARWLELPVIAEGVETLQQADYLRSIGCEIVQGYYYSRPVDADSFERLLKTSEKGSAEDTVKLDTWADIDSFWDPDSEAAVMFEGFIGAVGIFEYSNGHIEALRINENYYKTLGCTYEEYQAGRKDLFTLLYEEDIPILTEMLESAAKTGETKSCETRWRHITTGEMRWLEIKARIVANGTKSRIYYATVDNVTEKKRLSETLKKTRENMEQLCGMLSYAVIEYEIDEENMPVSVSYCNEAAKRMLVPGEGGNLLESLGERLKGFIQNSKESGKPVRFTTEYTLPESMGGETETKGVLPTLTGTVAMSAANTVQCFFFRPESV